MPDASNASGGPLEWRIWHFQSGNWEHLLRWIPKAPAMGINGIHITQNAVAWPWDVLDNPERVANLQRVFKTAKDNGLLVDFWMREISQVPDQYLRDGKAVLCDGLWDWLRDRYERIFDLLSNADGMILTTNECKYVVFRDLRVVSDLPHEQRIAKLVDVIAGVLHARGKQLIVRTFAYEPRELEFMRRAMQLIKPLSDKYGNITGLSKCVPMDWSPFWPYNPLLGDLAGVPELVEIDLGNEYTGLNVVPHCNPDYVKRTLAYARSKGIKGAVAWVERMEFTALGTPNEVDIHAFGRLCNDPNVSTDDLWREWVTNRYGATGADGVIRALKRTYDIVNTVYFPKQHWMTAHSWLPDFIYAWGHIDWLRNSKWTRSYHNDVTADLLLHPTLQTIEEIGRDNEWAEILCKRSLEDLDSVREHLEPEDHAELRRYLDGLMAVVQIWRAYSQAFFHASRCRDLKVAGSPQVPEAVSLVRQALGEFAAVVKSHEGNPASELWCNHASRNWRVFIEGIEKDILTDPVKAGVEANTT